MRAKHGRTPGLGVCALRPSLAQLRVKIARLTGERRRLVVLTSVTKHVFQALKNMGNMSSEELGLTNVFA